MTKVRIKVVPKSEPNAEGEWRVVEVPVTAYKANCIDISWSYLHELVGPDENVVAYETVK